MPLLSVVLLDMTGLLLQIKRQQEEEQYSERTLHRLKEAREHITKGNKAAKLHIKVWTGTPLRA